NDLRLLYLNRSVSVGNDEKGKPKYYPVADLWLRHKDRSQFIGGVTFDPSGKYVRHGVLNLWQGFAVQPRPGRWDRLQKHIRDVICCGRRDYFNYLVKWMARLIQHPAKQGEVAVVMRGGEGTGKGTLAKVLLYILGQHGMAIASSRHLTGNFN